MFLFFFFFFQAEDGIRDKLVTGVQTCALPICGSAADLPCGAPAGDWKHVLSCDSEVGGLVHQCIDYYATASAASAVDTSFRTICQVQQGTLLDELCPREGST